MTPLLPRALRARATRASAGFTLIEILAVMLIIGILMAFLVPQIPRIFGQARVTACRANLRDIGNGMLLYETKFDHLPRETGVGFFAALIADDVWEDTQKNATKLSCPEVNDEALTPFLEGIPKEEWYKDAKLVDGGWSAYAGRDTKNNPLRRKTMSGKEPLVADDNDPSQNHDGVTLVLMGDYNVTEFKIVEDRKAGLAGEEDPFVVVGPDAWHESLRKLTLD